MRQLRSEVFKGYIIQEKDIGDNVIVWKIVQTVTGRQPPEQLAYPSYPDLDTAKFAIAKHEGTAR